MGPVTYKLELPPSMKKAHNVFHISKLKPYVKADDESGPLPIVIDASGTIEHKVHAILSKKKHNRKIHYLVHFEGEPKTEAVWLPQSELPHCKELIKEYEKTTRTSKSKKR